MNVSGAKGVIASARTQDIVNREICNVPIRIEERAQGVLNVWLGSILSINLMRAIVTLLWKAF
jgi:hypothetical protein